MDGPKTRKAEETRKAPLKLQTDLWNNVRVLDSELGEIGELTVDEDFDSGSDPYNSTGQHVILELTKHENKSKSESEESEKDDGE